MIGNMELLSGRFLTIYLTASIIMGVLWMAIKVLKNLSIDKTIETLLQLPDDRKVRIIRLYRRIISSHRIVLWTMPFGLLLVLVAFVLLSAFPELNSGLDVDIRKLVMIMGILLVVGLIHVLEDSSYKKKILKAIDKS